MTYIIGQTNVITHGPLRVWPQGGRIHYEDSRDNSYFSEPVSKTKEKVRALTELVKNSLARNNDKSQAFYADEITRYKRIIDSYEKICKIAIDQGGPTNKDKIKESKRRRPKSVVKPNIIDMSKFQGEG